MNANQFNEKWIEFKGELKQRWDKFTAKYLEQIEGFLDSFIVKERWPQLFGQHVPFLKWRLAVC